MQVKKIANDVFSHLVLTLVGVFSQILIVPLYIRDFGPSGYSQISIILSLCAFVLISDYGFYITASTQLLRISKASHYFSLLLWKKYSKTVCLAFLAIAPILGFYFIYMTTNNSHLWESLKYEAIIFIFFLGAAGTSLVQHAQLIKFQVADNFGRGLKILTIMRLVEVIIQGACLYVRMDMLTFAIVTFIIRVLITVVFSILARSTLALKLLNSKPLNTEETFSLLRHSASNAAFNFTNLLGLHGTILIASLWMSPAHLFSLLITRMITSPIKYLSDSLINGGLPRFTRHFKELSESSETSARKSNYLSVFVFSSLGFIFMCAITIFLGPMLWKYLSLGHGEYSSALVVFFLVSTYLDSISAVVAMLRIARHIEGIIQYVYLASTILALALQYGFRYSWGVYSVPSSIIIGNLVFLFFTTSRVSRRRISK